MKVEYKAKNNNLIITCGVHENEYPRKLPNRKFSNTLHAWTAPCVRFNAQVIHDTWFDIPSIYISDEAKNAIKNTLAGFVIERHSFPAKYPFKMKPRDYQKKALDYTYSLKMCTYHMAMGSGKSKTVIDKLSCHYIEGHIQAIMIVCPCSVRHVWITQFAEHCPVEYELVICELKNAQNIRDVEVFESKDKSSKLKVLVVGVESLQLGTSKAMVACSKYMKNNTAAVVVDEAHDIKNSEAARSKNLMAITRNAEYRITMTGTPVSQGILDLYGIFEFLDPNIIGIGDFWSFKNRYAILQEMNIGSRVIKKVVGYQNIEELIELIRPFTFQVTKEEVAKELPNKIYLKRYVTMTKEQAQVYKDIQKEKHTEFENNKGESVILNITHILAVFTALQQVAGGFVSRGTGEFNSSGVEIRETLEVTKTNPKIVEIKKVISELDDTEQVIIWCKFRSEALALQKELYQYRTEKFKRSSVLYLDKTAEERREIETAMDNREIRYFISTPNSGGMGLTMNTAAYVIYYSNSLRLLHREQSEDRNHRIGQNRNVTYIDIIAENTVDEHILESLQNKKDLSEYVKTCLASDKIPF